MALGGWTPREGLADDAQGAGASASGAGVYEQGETVSLTASGAKCGHGAAKQYLFDQWERDGQVLGKDSMTMDASATVIAHSYGGLLLPARG